MILDEQMPNGLLTDEDIEEHINTLFSENASVCRAKYATYEIVVDSGYKIIEYDDKGTIKKIEQQARESKINVPPGTVIIVYSHEVFSLPENVYARVNTVGQIFSVGFSAENTYVDPGFRGRISITLINNTNRILSISVGNSLARVEFIKLAKKTRSVHLGQQGVRTSSITSESDKDSPELYNKMNLDDLLKSVSELTTLDTIPKKSIRTDVALYRTYVGIHSEIKKLNEAFEENKKNIIKNEKYLKYMRIATSVSIGTITFMIFYSSGLLESITNKFTDKDTPLYWLNIITGTLCSLCASYLWNIYSKKNIENEDS